jgi:hypothetical protein
MENTQINISAIDLVDQKWKGLNITSGVLWILGLFTSFLVAYLGRILYTPAYPADPAAYLQFISGRQELASAVWTIWIVSDLLAIVPTVAMYMILRPYNRTLALLGSLIVIFYIIYDVSVTELNSLTLVTLSHAYVATTSEVVRASLVGAAAYGYYALPLETVLSFGIGSLGWILWCCYQASYRCAIRAEQYGFARLLRKHKGLAGFQVGCAVL